MVSSNKFMHTDRKSLASLAARTHRVVLYGAILCLPDMQAEMVCALQAAHHWQQLSEELKTRLSQDRKDNTALGLELDVTLGCYEEVSGLWPHLLCMLAASTIPVCTLHSASVDLCCACCLHDL